MGGKPDPGLRAANWLPHLQKLVDGTLDSFGATDSASQSPPADFKYTALAEMIRRITPRAAKASCSESCQPSSHRRSRRPRSSESVISDIDVADCRDDEGVMDADGIGESSFE